MNIYCLQFDIIDLAMMGGVVYFDFWDKKCSFPTILSTVA